MYFVTWFILVGGKWTRQFAVEVYEGKAYQLADDLARSSYARGIKLYKGYEIGI